MALVVLPPMMTACDEDESTPSVRVEPVERRTPVKRASVDVPPERASQPATIVGPSAGQRLYVPVYSSVAFGAHTADADVAVRLMIRNVSEADAFEVVRVDFYDSDGELVESVVRTPLELTPLQTRSFLVESADLRAGAGGNFIVEWQAKRPVPPPLIETVNAYANIHQAFAFSGGARVMAELERE